MENLVEGTILYSALLLAILFSRDDDLGSGPAKHPLAKDQFLVKVKSASIRRITCILLTRAIPVIFSNMIVSP